MGVIDNKVFVVLAGWDYEGCKDEPLGVYDSRFKAELKVAECKADPDQYYDSYYVCEEKVL